MVRACRPGGSGRALGPHRARRPRSATCSTRCTAGSTRRTSARFLEAELGALLPDTLALIVRRRPRSDGSRSTSRTPSSPTSKGAAALPRRARRRRAHRIRPAVRRRQVRRLVPILRRARHARLIRGSAGAAIGATGRRRADSRPRPLSDGLALRGERMQAWRVHGFGEPADDVRARRGRRADRRPTSRGWRWASPGGRRRPKAASRSPTG